MALRSVTRRNPPTCTRSPAHSESAFTTLRQAAVTLENLAIRESPEHYGGWPFTINRARFDSLTDDQKKQIQGAVLNLILEFKGQNTRKAEIVSLADFRLRRLSLTRPDLT